MSPEQFAELVFRRIDGVATADDLAELNRCLRTRPDLADQFVEICGMDSLLYDINGEKALTERITRRIRRRPARGRGLARTRRRRRPAVFLYVAASLSAAALAFLVLRPFRSAERPAEVTEVTEVAEVTEITEVAKVTEVTEVTEHAPPAGGAVKRSIATLVETTGRVSHRRPPGERRAVGREGAALFAGDIVKSELGRARVEFESGTVVCLNRFTTLSLAAGAVGSTSRSARSGAVGSTSRSARSGADVRGISTSSGEVYVEAASAEKGFRVQTPHGRAAVLGTRFGVEVGPGGTTVTVVQGSVEASTEAGGVRLQTGQEVLLVRLTSPPGPVREAGDLDRRFVWAAREVVFHDDFRRAPLDQWPRGWERHATEAHFRSGFMVLHEPGRAGERFVGCTPAAGGTFNKLSAAVLSTSKGGGNTQHCFIPVRQWPDSFRVFVRIRMAGPRNTRAGVQLESPQKRSCLSLQYDAQARTLVAEDRSTSKVFGSVPLDLGIGGWHAFEVTARGGGRSSCAVRVDGREMFTVRLPEVWPVARVSLLSRGEDSAHYDEVTVARLTGTR